MGITLAVIKFMHKSQLNLMRRLVNMCVSDDLLFHLAFNELPGNKYSLFSHDFFL